ncbi:hypothetical protein O3P69_008268 [Scylla paramamosain]|uniref:Uncharacterized protein n=1 Tax=Scylla paramamosain TaxID=85552 RepID=A0AAW0T1D7_SCYPA
MYPILHQNDIPLESLSTLLSQRNAPSSRSRMNFVRVLSVLMVVVVLMSTVSEAGPLLRNRGRGSFGRGRGVANGISPIYGDTYANFATEARAAAAEVDARRLESLTSGPAGPNVLRVQSRATTYLVAVTSVSGGHINRAYNNSQPRQEVLQSREKSPQVVSRLVT